MGKITGTLVQMAEQRKLPVLVVAGDGTRELTLDDLESSVRAGLHRLLAP